jgi:hypothetical protein
MLIYFSKNNLLRQQFGDKEHESAPTSTYVLSVGVSCEYGEPIEKGEYRGTHTTVGDQEHATIIRLYVDEGLSMNKIADKLGRSSRVPYKHIHQHNSKVEGAGFCPACRRVKSNLDKTLARRK